MKRFLLLPVILLSLFACARPPATTPEQSLAPPSWWRSVSLQDDMAFKDIAAAARQSLAYYQKLLPDSAFLFGPRKVTALDMTVTLQNFLLIVENDSLTPQMKLDQIGKEFEFYPSTGSDGRGRVLFTGYYEPTLSCRTAPDAVYRYPLYRKPNDIIEIDLTLFGNDFPRNKLLARIDGKKVLPYFSREEIDGKKALAGRDLEFLWCGDLVDIAVLQVQGSGKADLGDGNIVSILYDGQNGRPYRSIGKYLLDKGAITQENKSMPAIREYLRAHPEEVAQVLNQNPSYVFFRMDMGPSVGNIGVPLTPGRSIATDARLFPKGAPALIDTQKPVLENGIVKEWQPFTRFVMNQDTGGAIRGPGRVDLFWGQGNEAELSAGYMQQEGRLYFLLRKRAP